MSAPVQVRILFDVEGSVAIVQALGEVVRRASKFEALSEVRDRLLDLGDFARELFRVDVEDVAGAAGELRASLQLTDAGRDLSAALGAGDVDLLVVKQALVHVIRSCVSQPGVDAESGPGETSVPAERDGAERAAPEREPLEGRVTREAEWLNPGLGRPREPGA